MRPSPLPPPVKFFIPFARTLCVKKGRNCKTNPISDATDYQSTSNTKNIFKNTLSKTYWRFAVWPFGRVQPPGYFGLFRSIAANFGPSPPRGVGVHASACQVRPCATEPPKSSSPSKPCQAVFQEKNYLFFQAPSRLRFLVVQNRPLGRVMAGGCYPHQKPAGWTGNLT